MAAELQNTAAIIKKTGIFDDVDNIYGDYDAMHNGIQQQPQQGIGEGGPGAIGGGGGAGGFDGGSLASDSLGGAAEMGGEVGDANGNESTVGMEQAPGLDNGTNESVSKSKKPIITEKTKSFTQRYFELLSESEKEEESYEEPTDYEGKTEFLNEQIDNIFSEIDNVIKLNHDENKVLLEDIVTEGDIVNELLGNNEEK